MLRLSLQCIIWWWHLVFKVGCVPQLTTKLGWLVKVKLIQELESKCVPSVLVLSFFHQDDDLALTLPKIYLIFLVLCQIGCCKWSLIQPFPLVFVESFDAVHKIGCFEWQTVYRVFFLEITPLCCFLVLVVYFLFLSYFFFRIMARVINYLTSRYKL